MSETIRCPFCIDGEWFANPEFKEPYGYPYRAAKIPCEVCKGTKAVLKTTANNITWLEKITPKQRKELMKKMEKKI